MFIDIQKTYNKIENDLLANTDELFNRYDYYTHKYRGNRLNDINVGLFLNDNQQPTAQIFIRNKNGYIKKHLIFDKAGTTLLNINTLNYKIND